jgi:hypothetical protein
MGFEIKNTPSASAPDIDPGLRPALLTGITQVAHPEWAGPNKFGNYDNGDRWHWEFTLLDDDGQPAYEDGDPVTITQINSATFNTKSDKSKNALWVKAVAPDVFRSVDAGLAPTAEQLENLPCMILVEIKENGWPVVTNVLPPLKKSKRAAPVAAVDED